MTNQIKTGAYIISEDSLVVVIGGVNYTISKTSALYRKVAGAVITSNWPAAQKYLEQANQLKGEIWWNADESLIYYGTEPLHHSLADRLPRILAEGFDTAPMVAFLKNLFLNPAEHAISELYEFMERNALPITSDGCFLAYKKVREDYLDCHSSSVDNHVGQKPEMDRDKCDPARYNHCSTGYHFCGLSYLSCFGGERVMIVKVNPADVTSIPNDYDFAKGRCCKYEVIDEYLGTAVPHYDDAFSSSVAPGNFEDLDEFYCDECGAEDESDCDCGRDFSHKDDELIVDVPNLFSKPVETQTTQYTNPITRARVRDGLSVAQVAEALGMSVQSYQNRVEVEGRFFKPSTVGRILQVIETLAQEE